MNPAFVEGIGNQLPDRCEEEEGFLNSLRTLFFIRTYKLYYEKLPTSWMNLSFMHPLDEWSSDRASLNKIWINTGRSEHKYPFFSLYTKIFYINASNKVLLVYTAFHDKKFLSVRMERRREFLSIPRVKADECAVEYRNWVGKKRNSVTKCCR